MAWPAFPMTPTTEADVDDAPAPLLDHGPARGPDTIEGALEIDSQDRIPFRFFHTDDEIVPGDARIIHQDVQAPALFEDVVQALVDRRGIGHIEFHQPGRGAFGLHLLLGPDGFLAQDHVIEIDGQTRLGQGQGNGPADSPGAAGHQGYT